MSLGSRLRRLFASLASTRPGPRAALAVALLTAAVCGGGTLVAADAVGDAVTGTTTIDNPSRPPADVCESRSGTPGAFDPCSAPATVTVDRAGHAATAVRQLLPGTLLAVGGAWLLFTGAFAAAGSVRVVGSRTAWALPPLALPAALRLVTVSEAAAVRSWPAEIDALAVAARRTATLADDPTATAVGLVGLAGAGAALYAVGARTEGAWWGPLAAVLAPTVYAVGPLLGTPTPQSLSVGLTVAVVGLPAAFAPRRLVRLATATLDDWGSPSTQSGDGVVTERPLAVARIAGLAGLAAGLVVAGLPAYLL